MKNRLGDLDKRLLLSVLCLVIIGIVLIYSADHSLGIKSHVVKQIYIGIIGVVLLSLAAFAPPRIYYAFAYILYAIGILGLIIVLLSGIIGLGAKRWLIIGGVHIQPSEPMKIALIIAGSRILSERHSSLSHWKIVAKIGLLCMVPTLLVLLQPDLGTATVFPIVLIAMLVWFGLPLRVFILFLLPLLSLFLSIYPWFVLPLVLAGFIALWKQGVRWTAIIGVILLCVIATIAAPKAWNQLEPYQQKRLTTFMDPAADPLGSGYQIIQSKVAIGSGGISGQGFLMGTQTQLRFLPEQHTDFIFALAGEEFGFVGVTVIIILFTMYGWNGYLLASRTKNQFMSFVAVGITTFILYHAVVNIGMVVGLLPVTGLPLPFLSYGGSFLLTCLIGSGILLSVGIYRRER